MRTYQLMTSTAVNCAAVNIAHWKNGRWLLGLALGAAMRLSRTRPLRTIPIYIGARAGRLLDVSDIGLRFELDWPAEDEIPSTMILAVGTQSVTVPVIVVWKLQEGDRPWICGALVSAHGRAEWRRLLATLSLTASYEAWRASNSS